MTYHTARIRDDTIAFLETFDIATDLSDLAYDFMPGNQLWILSAWHMTVAYFSTYRKHGEELSVVHMLIGATDT